MLELEDITVSYPDGEARRRVVDDVSLVAEDGVLTCLVGPSGSGKSTLLAVAAGLTTPDSGRVLVDGRSLTGRPAELSRMRRDQVGIVFQQSNLLAGLTAVEQLLVMAHLQGKRPSSGGARAAELLDLLGVGDLADRRPHQMSGGQRQRVAVARALMNRPRVLLADEPTSALDTERGDALVATLTDLTHDQGVATLLVTHDPRHAERSDRVLRIVDGRLDSPVPATA